MRVRAVVYVAPEALTVMLDNVRSVEFETDTGTIDRRTATGITRSRDTRNSAHRLGRIIDSSTHSKRIVEIRIPTVNDRSVRDQAPRIVATVAIVAQVLWV